jgi:hypothetical protein
MVLAAPAGASPQRIASANPIDPDIHYGVGTLTVLLSGFLSAARFS